MPDRTSARTSEDMADRMPVRLSENMPEDRPDRTPDVMSERMFQKHVKWNAGKFCRIECQKVRKYARKNASKDVRLYAR